MSAAPLTTVLARRFLRGRRLASGATVVSVTVAFLVVSYMTLHALSLAPEQRVEEQLGRAGASVDFGGLIADAKPGAGVPRTRLAAAARSAGLERIAVERNSLDVQLVSRPAQRVPYVERDWRAGPFPDRYALTAGRWPARPGETVVTNAPEAGVTKLGRLRLFSGRASFHVVGFARDRYSEAPRLLAAPGGWATLDPRIAEDFPTAVATLRVYTASADEQRLVRFALTLAGPGGDGSPPLDEDSVRGGIATPGVLAGTADAVWFERMPAAYRVPALLLPLLAVLLVFGLNDRWLRQRIRMLTDAGVSRRLALRALMVALLVAVVVATIAGAALGIGLALAARPILSAFQAQPLSPPAAPVAPVATALAVALAGWLAGFVVIARGQFERREHSTRLRVRSRRRRDARQLAALGAACVAVVLTAEIQTASDTMVLAAVVAVALLLVTPDVVQKATAALRDGNAVARLAKRQLLADLPRVSIVVAAMGASLGLPLGFLTLLDTTLATEQTEHVSDVRPGQLYLSSVAGTLHPASPSVQRIVATNLESAPPPIDLSYLVAGNGATIVTAPGLDDTFILAVPQVSQIETLLGAPLPAAGRTVLRDGGMLAWNSTASRQRLNVIEGADAHVGRSLTIAAHGVPSPRVGWTKGSQGVMLSATARTLDLPLSQGARFYSGLSDDQVRHVTSVIADAGLDTEQLTAYAPPEPVVPAVAQVAAALALALLVTAVAVSMARAQVVALRRYLSTLLAIGITPAWTRRVLLTQQGLALGLATVLGLLIAVPPVVAAAVFVPDVKLSVPETSLVALLGCVYAAAFGVTLVAARFIHADGRAGGYD